MYMQKDIVSYKNIEVLIDKNYKKFQDCIKNTTVNLIILVKLPSPAHKVTTVDRKKVSLFEE